MKKTMIEDDTRIRSGFLFLPKTIRYNGVEKTRWLERASWEEVVRPYFGDLYWYDYRWIDEEE